MMEVPEDILRKSCTAECRRHEAGNCPFTSKEKEYCPRVKEKMRNT